MFPQRELIRLADRKAALRLNIAYGRIQCAEAAARVTRPLQWLDRVVAFWRRLSPFAKLAAVPLGLLAKRTVSKRMKLLGSLVRWAPVFYGAVRGMKGQAKAHPGAG